MLKSFFASKRPLRGERRCKCCGATAAWFGAVDFSKSCEDAKAKVLPDSGRMIDYFRCSDCGFLFTELIDDWSSARVAAEIYNADYVRVDPDFVATRPLANAQLLAAGFQGMEAELSILDYGGGNGDLARHLRAARFVRATSYDPFHDGGADKPAAPSDLVTAFEVVEHAPDPVALFEDVARLVADGGAFLFTTLLQPSDIATVGLGWWYAAPRNGHVSLHTRASLEAASKRGGWHVESFDSLLHVAWRTRPAWLDRFEAMLAKLGDAAPPSVQPARFVTTRDASMSAAPIVAARQCRHGRMSYFPHDAYVGRSLDLYGEFSEGEVDLFRQLLRPGDTVLEAGANIGAHTVFLAQAVGPQGRVLGYEPQRAIFDLLRINLEANALPWADARLAALGSTVGTIRVPPLDYSAADNFGGVSMGGTAGELVAVETIDGLDLPRLKLLKIDVEGMETDVLRGATATIWRTRPYLYVENDREENSSQLIAVIQSLGYRLWWHAPALFNPGNFAGNSDNVFGTVGSINLFCVPEEVETSVGGLRGVTSPRDRFTSQAFSRSG